MASPDGKIGFLGLGIMGRQAVEQSLGEQHFAAVIEPIATKFGLK